jgi:hypothetical protein
MTFTTYARSLAAALMVGIGILSFSPGQTGYAAVGDPTEGGSTDAGADSGTTERRPQPRKDDGTRCVLTLRNGHIDFYLPGDVITSPYSGKRLICTPRGDWALVALTGGGGDTRPPGGGGYAP